MRGLHKITIKKEPSQRTGSIRPNCGNGFCQLKTNAARNKLLKADHYPERSDAKAMLHPEDETFSSNMQFEAVLRRKGINALR